MDLLGGQAQTDAHERWRSIVSAPIDAVAARARGGVHRRASAWRAPGGRKLCCVAHCGDPRCVARVDEEHARLAVDSRSTPLAAAVEAGQHDAAFTTRWHEQTLRTQAAKAALRRRVRVRREIGEVRLGHRLPREGGRSDWKRLRRPRLLPGQVRCRYRTLLDREERLSRRTIEHKDEAALRDLRDGIHAIAAAHDRNEVRRGGEITVPEIVMHGLEMPDALPGFRIERKQRVREQIRADAAAAIEVGRGRACWDVNNATVHIQAHSRPRVRTAGGLPRLDGPGVVTDLARTRNGVKGPPDSPGANVIGANVAWGRPFALTDACPLNEKVLVDDTGARRDKKSVVDVAAEADGEVNEPRISKAGNGTSGACVESIEAASGGKKDPLFITLRPPRDTAVSVRLTSAAGEGIEAP